MVQLGPEYDFAVRLKTLEDEVRRMQANGLGQAFSATQSDGSVGMSIVQNTTGSGSTALVFYQGPNSTRDPNTGLHSPLLYIGELFVEGASVDSGVLLWYPNGDQLAALGSSGFIWHDPTQQVVLSNDQASGEGLARPWLPLPIPQQTGIGNWPKTTGSGTVAESRFEAQHPKVSWQASVTADAGVTCTAQLQLTSGAQSVSSQVHTATGGTFTGIDEVLTLPQPFFGQQWQANVNVAVTAGTGNGYCQTFGLYGRQS